MARNATGVELATTRMSRHDDVTAQPDRMRTHDSIRVRERLISIVVGLAIARVLGGIGTFMRQGNRSASDWIVAAWCLALVFGLVGWWWAGWTIFSDRTEIGVATLIVWLVATSLLYLAAMSWSPTRDWWWPATGKPSHRHSPRPSSSAWPRTSEWALPWG